MVGRVVPSHITRFLCVFTLGIWHIYCVSTRIYRICGCISWLFGVFSTTYGRLSSGNGRISARFPPASESNALHAAGPDSNYRSSVFCAPLRKKIGAHVPVAGIGRCPTPPPRLRQAPLRRAPAGVGPARRGVRNLYGNVRFVYGFCTVFAGKSGQKRGFGRPGGRTGGAQGSGSPCHIMTSRRGNTGRQRPDKTTRRGRKRAPIGRKPGPDGLPDFVGDWDSSTVAAGEPRARQRREPRIERRSAPSDGLRPTGGRGIPTGIRANRESRRRHGLFHD